MRRRSFFGAVVGCLSAIPGFRWLNRSRPMVSAPATTIELPEPSFRGKLIVDCPLLDKPAEFDMPFRPDSGESDATT